MWGVGITDMFTDMIVSNQIADLIREFRKANRSALFISRQMFGLIENSTFLIFHD